MISSIYLSVYHLSALISAPGSIQNINEINNTMETNVSWVQAKEFEVIFSLNFNRISWDDTPDNHGLYVSSTEPHCTLGQKEAGKAYLQLQQWVSEESFKKVLRVDGEI